MTRRRPRTRALRTAMRFVLACALMRSAPAAGPGLVDDWGRRVVPDGQPGRIVSLAPHATELLFAAGLGPQVVAVDRDSDHPAAVAGLPRLAALPQPSVERLLALRPDLVVVWGPGVRPGFIEQLEAIGLAVFVSSPRTLDDVAATLARFAALSTGAAGSAAADAAGNERPASGADVARRFSARLAALRARWMRREPVSVFVQIWSTPLITIGDADVIGDAIRSCGGVNVAGALPAAAPRVDIEWVVAMRPRLIVATDSPDSRQRWREVGLLAPRGPARFVSVDPTLLQRPGPRVLEAVERLCEAIDAVRTPMPSSQVGERALGSPRAGD